MRQTGSIHRLRLNSGAWPWGHRLISEIADERLLRGH